MSHLPERKEKDCLNCGSIVHGRFCHKCGQENIVTKETFWSLVNHFFQDITHFDNKFFETLKYILFKPGYISKEYVSGKRASYLHPIRMYLFTSALFFLIFFLLKDPKKSGILTYKETPIAKNERSKLIEAYKRDLVNKPNDTATMNNIAILSDTTREVNLSDLVREQDGIIGYGNVKYRSIEAYDSVQKSLPLKERHIWWKKQLVKRSIIIDNKYRGDAKKGVEDISEIFMHKLPYFLFVSLPFFALILKLLYVRRKEYYYSDHAIFTLHLYIFSFILLLIIFSIGAVQDWLHLDFLQIPIVLLSLCLPVYLYKAMRHFYKQSRGKTILKFLLLNFLALLVLGSLLFLFLIFSVFQI